MSTIYLQVIQGLERGELFPDVSLPATIGREDENAIQLNDERISRCHVKLQRDENRVLLTDLQSTNGTRVNGLPVQMTVLQPGDLITVGRCVLLYGSPEEIASHCQEQHQKALAAYQNRPDSDDDDSSSDTTSGLFDEHGQPAVSFPGGRPVLPSFETLASRSELSDLLSYLHSRMLQSLQSRGEASDHGEDDEHEDSCVEIPWPKWQKLLELESDLSTYLRELTEPE